MTPTKPLDGVSRETLDKLELYVELLEKWQAKINLVSPSTLPDAWNRHIVDSTQVAKLVPNEVKTIADLGSGAGFPGLVTAIMRPDIDVSLVESDSKKCAFLQTVSRETGVKVTIHNKRIESVVDAVGAPDLVMARALASLDELLGYCKPWIEGENPPIFLFPKGAQAADEIEIARKKWDFSCDITPSITDKAASILLLHNVKKHA